jgi:hypothetical protein
MSERIDAIMDRIDAAQAVVEVALDAMPLDFLLAVFRDSRQPMKRRMDAAEIAAPFIHPKLAMIGTANVSGDFGTMLERAIQRSNAVRPIKMIEAKAVPVKSSEAAEVSSERMKQSFQSLRRRF